MDTKNFTREENKILSEIYRRLNFFHDGKLNAPMLYLGYPSDVKVISKYELIKPYSTETARVLNWYNLTDKGKKFFSNYVTKQKLSQDTNRKIFNGEYIKSFDKSLL